LVADNCVESYCQRNSENDEIDGDRILRLIDNKYL
jgi:hypothetical protein